MEGGKMRSGGGAVVEREDEAGISKRSCGERWGRRKEKSGSDDCSLLVRVQLQQHLLYVRWSTYYDCTCCSLLVRVQLQHVPLLSLQRRSPPPVLYRYQR